jgi:endogenous inhibitor of DNA gyrase (YacG/DUF329 family)
VIIREICGYYSYEECPACGEKVLATKISQELFEKKMRGHCFIGCFGIDVKSWTDG